METDTNISPVEQDTAAEPVTDTVPVVSGPSDSRTRITMFIGGVAVGAILGASGFAALDNFVGIPISNSDAEIAITDENMQQIVEAMQYKDGKYIAEIAYPVPAADKEHIIQVELEIVDEKVVSVAIVEVDEAGAEIENEYLVSFVDELTGIISGQPIDVIGGMDLVSGSTLTSDAFKEAIVEVQSEAKELQEVAGKYKDGEYYAQAYFDVSDQDGIGHWLGATVTLKDGIVEDVVVVEVDEDGTLVENERISDTFDAALEGIIVGKPITKSQNLETVNGSSYTTIGFNDAIDMIHQDALIN